MKSSSHSQIFHRLVPAIASLATVFLAAGTRATGQGIAVANSGASAADADSGQLLEFEAASIKPVDKPFGVVGLQIYPGGRVVIPLVTLKSLICTAFDISCSWQLSGGEDWIDKTVFDVEAEAPASMAAGISLRHSWFRIEDPNLRLMLQSLLIDRFQLKVHTETKTGTVYWLVRDGKSVELRPAKTDKLFAQAGEGYTEIVPNGGAWSMANASMPQLAKYLSTYILHTPVLDKTGLDGSFDFRSTSEPDPRAPDRMAALLPGLAEMGLKIRQAQGSVEYFVIDHAEQLSPN